jgi:ubiquinone biosynthesis protein
MSERIGGSTQTSSPARKLSNRVGAPPVPGLLPRTLGGMPTSTMPSKEEIALPAPPFSKIIFRLLQILAEALWYYARKESTRVVLYFSLDDARDRVTELDERSALRLKAMIERLGGAAIKIGQQMAMRLDVLPRAYCDALESLLDEAEAVDPVVAQRTIFEELEKKPVLYKKNILRKGMTQREALDAVFEFIDLDHPLGNASIASVFPAILRTGQPVAVKVMRPDVRMSFATDLTVLDRLLKAAEFLTVVNDGRSKSFRAELRNIFQEELSFRQEIRYQELFRTHHRRRRRLKVSAPKVYYDYSADRMIVSEFIQGISVRNIQKAIDDGDQCTLDLLKRFNIKPKKIAKRLLWASHYGFFECPFFHGDPHPGNILVLPDSRIYMIDFGACGVFAEKERKVFRQMHRYKIQNDVGGMVQCVIKLAEPLPPMDIHGFTKELEAFWWHGSYGVESKHPEWWERTSYRLWTGLLELSRKHEIPMPLSMLRMIRATLMYDTVAARLHPKINVFKEYQKYDRERNRRTRARMLRSFCRQICTGPDPELFALAHEAWDTGKLMLFRVRQFLDETRPFLNFMAIADRISHFINDVNRLFNFVIWWTLTGVLAWVVRSKMTIAGQNIGQAFVDTPQSFMTQLRNGDRTAESFVGVWILGIFIFMLLMYRRQAPRLLEANIDRDLT